GVLLILFWGRARKARSTKKAAASDSVAARLRPLVCRAMSGTLSVAERAELERTLLSFWRQRLGLVTEKAPEALATLRKHPEAGVLLNQLDMWLHRPGTTDAVEVDKVLRPYLDAQEHRPGDKASHGGAAS